MAWLKGLAGKAEDFLNQIDQNAAVALQGDKKISDSKESLLTEVKWEGPSPISDLNSAPSQTWTRVSNTKIPSVQSSPNLKSLSPSRTPKKQNDEELISFLNRSDRIGQSPVSDQVPLPLQSEENSDESENNSFAPIKFETLNEKLQNNLNSESSHSSRRSSPRDVPDPVPQPQPQPVSMPTMEKFTNGIATQNHVSDITTENEMLRNELRTINNEMSLLLQRAKKAEKECQRQQILLTQLQERSELVNKLEQELQAARQQMSVFQERIHSLQVENEKLVNSSSENDTENDAYKSLLEELETVKNKHKHEITSMESRVQKTEQEKQNIEQQLVDLRHQMNQRENVTSSLQQQLERARLEAQSAQDELEQYRLRAQRILQDKEKLINELRGEGQNPQGSQDETVILELQQLRQERELLREETAQVSARLQAVREELLETEKRLETCREKAADAETKLLQEISEERRRRQAAEEDCKTHADELRSVRDELSRQRSLLASRVKEREAELTRLRTQLAQRPASPSDEELESRLHALTQTLVQKQNTLETVTTEKNALRLQLEKLERKNQEAMKLLQQRQVGLIHVNDTDDAKAQIPTFFVESPFDTGMTRRVKRAYSSLDAVSIRTGVFLRRYPLARILVLCYMILLHLWVMLVLFTYTPQAQ